MANTKVSKLRSSAEVSDEELSEELERLQQRHAELTVIDEGASQSGDIVVIDFDGFVDGVPFEGGQAERYSLSLEATRSFQALKTK